MITDIDPEIFRMLLGYLYTSIPLDVKDKARQIHMKNIKINTNININLPLHIHSLDVKDKARLVVSYSFFPQEMININMDIVIILLAINLL